MSVCRCRAQRIAVLAGLLCAVAVVFVVVNRPGLAIYMYALIPLVLGVQWFQLAGGLAVAAAATLSFIGAQLVVPSGDPSVPELWVAAFNRSVVFVGVAVLVSLLLWRERALAYTVRAQADEITELASLRAALTPTTVPARPHLEFATSFTPARGSWLGTSSWSSKARPAARPSRWVTSSDTAWTPPGAPPSSAPR